eukprot:scaffold131541_cov65-Attheya_sp.AAC.2
MYQVSDSATFSSTNNDQGLDNDQGLVYNDDTLGSPNSIAQEHVGYSRGSEMYTPHVIRATKNDIASCSIPAVVTTSTTENIPAATTHHEKNQVADIDTIKNSTSFSTIFPVSPLSNSNISPNGRIDQPATLQCESYPKRESFLLPSPESINLTNIEESRHFIPRFHHTSEGVMDRVTSCESDFWQRSALSVAPSPLSFSENCNAFGSFQNTCFDSTNERISVPTIMSPPDINGQRLRNATLNLRPSESVPFGSYERCWSNDSREETSLAREGYRGDRHSYDLFGTKKRKLFCSGRNVGGEIKLARRTFTDRKYGLRFPTQAATAKVSNENCDSFGHQSHYLEMMFTPQMTKPPMQYSAQYSNMFTPVSISSTSSNCHRYNRTYPAEALPYSFSSDEKDDLDFLCVNRTKSLLSPQTLYPKKQCTLDEGLYSQHQDDESHPEIHARCDTFVTDQSGAYPSQPRNKSWRNNISLQHLSNTNFPSKSICNPNTSIPTRGVMKSPEYVPSYKIRSQHHIHTPSPSSMGPLDGNDFVRIMQPSNSCDDEQYNRHFRRSPIRGTTRDGLSFGGSSYSSGYVVDSRYQANGSFIMQPPSLSSTHITSLQQSIGEPKLMVQEYEKIHAYSEELKGYDETFQQKEHRIIEVGPNKKKRRKCTAESCTNRVVQGGLCIAHGAKRKKCGHQGCTKHVKLAGMCSAHGPARQLCGVHGCSKISVQGARCVRHGAKMKTCCVASCTKRAIKTGMCTKHHNQKQNENTSMP